MHQGRGKQRCQVDGCVNLLPAGTVYHARYKICQEHATAAGMILNNSLVRFCQQCGRFQPLGDFDATKRSCRRKLQMHNAQRKRVRDATKDATTKDAASNRTPSHSPMMSPRSMGRDSSPQSQTPFVSPPHSSGTPVSLPLLVPLSGSPRGLIPVLNSSSTANGPHAPTAGADAANPANLGFSPLVQRFTTQMSLDGIDLDAALEALDYTELSVLPSVAMCMLPTSLLTLPVTDPRSAVAVPALLDQQHGSAKAQAVAAPPDIARNAMLQLPPQDPPQGLT